jgi:hypothetical protein
MAGPEGSRRNYLTLQALDPASGSSGEVLISYDRMQAVARRSMAHAKECGIIVPMILQRPSAVFGGLRQDEDEDRQGVGWRCYCGIPDQAYHSDGSARPPYPGQVYLVFVNDEGVAYNWRWEKADPDHPELPQNHETRFRKRLL